MCGIRKGCIAVICGMCRTGGKWNIKWRQDRDKPTTMYAHWLLLAEESHKMCTGCECQHAVGDHSLVVVPQDG
jgi:hypothetical protein